MTESARRTTGVHAGPRSADVVSRITAAAYAELHRVGYAQMTMDGVARAAGVNRTTLYRRWPSKAELVTSLMAPALESYDALPFTGDASSDVMLLMRQLRDNSMQPAGRAILAAFGSGEADLAEVVTPLTERIRAAFRQALAGLPGADAAQLDAAAHLLFYGVAAWPESHGSEPSDDDLRRMYELVAGSFSCDPHAA